MAVHDRHTFAEVLKFARREFKSAFDIIYDSSMYRFLRRQIQIANRRMSDDVLHVGFIRTGAQAIEVWAQVKDNEVRFYSGAADDYLLSTIEPFPSNGMTRITGLTYPFDLINGAISNDASPKKPKTISQNKAKLGLALMIKFAFLLTDRLTHLEQRGYTSTPKAFKEMCLHLQEQKSAQGGQGGAVAKIEDEDDVVMLEGPVEQTLALANTPAPRQITAQLDQPDDAQCAHQPHLETSQCKYLATTTPSPMLTTLRPSSTLRSRKYFDGIVPHYTDRPQAPCAFRSFR